jgi:branched-chain amino acid transport system substrate-binding protein
MDTTRLAVYPRCLSRFLLMGLVLVLGMRTLHAEPGVTSNEIVLGQSVAMSGPFAPVGTQFVAGAKMYFDAVNNRGGVLGRKITLVTLDISGSDAAEAALALSRTNPEAIIFCGAGKAIADLIAAYQATGAKPQFMALSAVASDVLVKVLGPASYGIAVAQTMPYPWNKSLPVIREYQSLKAAQQEMTYTYLNVLGFISARVMVEALKRTGKMPTRETLIQTLEKMSKVDIDGFTVDFSPTDHHGSKFVDLTIIGRDGRFRR